MNYYKRHIGGGGRWIEVDSRQTMAIPAAAGVYVFSHCGMAVYVGSTENLRTRIRQHGIKCGYGKNVMTPWGTFPLEPPLVCKVRPASKCGDWLMIEYRLIKRLRPHFNIRNKDAAA